MCVKGRRDTDMCARASRVSIVVGKVLVMSSKDHLEECGEGPNGQRRDGPFIREPKTQQQ